MNYIRNVWGNSTEKKEKAQDINALHVDSKASPKVPYNTSLFVNYEPSSIVSNVACSQESMYSSGSQTFKYQDRSIVPATQSHSGYNGDWATGLPASGKLFNPPMHIV